MSLQALEKKLQARKVDDIEFDVEEVGSETTDADLPYVFDEAKDYKVENDARVHKYWLSTYAKNRVLSNQNYIVLFVGSTGSGKSYSAMELAMDIDPYFNADRIVFYPVDFIRIAKQGLPPGSVIMWDEVGVGLSNRDWWSIQNKMIAFILETFRRDRLILIMTTPNINFIDKKVRVLLHGYAETIDKTFTGGKFGYVKYFHIVTNLREGKMMYRYPRIRDKYGRIRVIQAKNSMSGNMRFTKPPEEISLPYEEKKLTFTENIKVEALELASSDTKSTRLEIPRMIEIFKESPEEYGLLDEESTVSEIINTAYVRLSLNHPAQKISKSVVDSTVKYIMKEMGIQPTDSKMLGDDQFQTVWDLYQTHNNVRGVANAMNQDVEIVKRSVKSWKKRGMWNE